MKNLHMLLLMICAFVAMPAACIASGFRLPRPGAAMKLRVWPDKGYDRLYISCNENIEYASVYDMAGYRLLYVEGSITSLNVSKLPSGIYLLKCRTYPGLDLVSRFLKV